MTQSQQLEKKIARSAKIVQWLFIGLMVILAGEIIGLAVTAWIVVHHH